MARLILQEGGATRRFRLNKGKLTIGSGAEATLKLESDGVAEKHAELVFDGERAVLRVQPGVLPVTVGGRRVKDSVELAPGAVAKIGEARISVEQDEAQPGTAGASGRVARTPARAQAAAGGAVRKAGATRGAAGTRRGARGRDDGAPPRVEHARRQLSGGPGVPTWLILLLVAAGGVAGWYALGGFAESSGKRMVSEVSVQRAVEDALKTGDFGTASEQFERLDQAVDQGTLVLTPEWKEVFDGLRAETEALAAEGVLAQHNVKGNEFLQTQLKNFEKTYLKDNERPEARVFLRRLAWFKGEYPRHPQIDWCERMEARYAPIAKMGEPDTYEDMAFHVKTLTWAKPRDYVQAFAIIENYLKDATGEDRDKALALFDEKEDERDQYFTECIEQAAYFWERKQESQAVALLVQLVTKIGDPTLADDAARRIVDMGEYVVPAMRGYQNDRPEYFATLAANPIMRDFLEEAGVL